MKKEDRYRQEAIKLLKLQKHDTSNILQIALSYIQLNRNPEAEQYIKAAMKEMQCKGAILNIVYPRLVLSLLSQMDKAFRLAVPLTVECKSDLKDTLVNEDLLTELFEKVWDAVIASQLRFPREERVINFIIDSDDSFVFFVNDNLKTHIKTETINELNILFSKVGYGLVCSDEVLRITKI